MIYSLAGERSGLVSSPANQRIARRFHQPGSQNHAVAAIRMGVFTMSPMTTPVTALPCFCPRRATRLNDAANTAVPSENSAAVRELFMEVQES